MNRNSIKSNWASKAITLLAFLSITGSVSFADTVLIQDGFSGNYNSLGGTTPDTKNTPGNSWVSGHFNRGISATWTASPVLSDYTGSNTTGAGISFAGSAQNILTLSVDMYKSTGDQSGNALSFGFSTASVLTNSSVDSGSYEGFVLGTGGLGVRINSDGSGDLLLSGVDQAIWGAPADFIGSTGNGSTVGENSYQLQYNDITGVATVTEAGDLVASQDIGAGISFNSAGLGAFYSTGWHSNNSGAPDGFDNFTVSTEAVVATPEPSTMALLFAGVAGLVFFRRFRSTSVRS